MSKETDRLKNLVRKLFAESLKKTDPRTVLEKAVKLEGERLTIDSHVFNLERISKIIVVAIGKAGFSMAAALDAILGNRIIAGVISAPDSEIKLRSKWRVFEGGHPLPNRASIEAGNTAVSLMRSSDHEQTLVIYLISGGGSAMIEMPRDERISLLDLRSANEILIRCGARIDEINAVRRGFSKLKGGGLRNLAPKATHISLIISDTNRRDQANVASGPTIDWQRTERSNQELTETLGRFDLRKKFPPMITAAINEYLRKEDGGRRANVSDFVYVLLDNEMAVKAAVDSALGLGITVVAAQDLAEAPVGSGCRQLVDRLCALRAAVPMNTEVAVISGGEFVCPVRGDGIGGRNSEAALRAAILFDELHKTPKWRTTKFAALFAGTDGIDGNSPAAGAIADETTINRAKEYNLEATEYLTNSDSYSFFNKLGDQIEIGPTGTNLRDLRILIAG